MALLRPNDVRDRLIGVDLSDLAPNESAQDRLLWEAVVAGQDRVAKRVDLQIEPVVVKVFPADTLVLGVDYDVLERPYDYQAADWYGSYGPIRTRRQPVLSVEGVRIAWDADSALLTYPSGWFEAVFKGVGGLVNVRPDGESTASILISGVGWFYLPMLTGGWARQDMVPGMVAIDYTAGMVYTTTLSASMTAAATTCIVASMTGLAPKQYVRVEDELLRVNSVVAATKTLTVARGQRGTEARAHANGTDVIQWRDEHSSLRRALSSQAALYVLGDKQESGSDGKSSVSTSADGLSQSRSFTKYANVIQYLQQDLIENCAILEGKYHPIPMAVM